MKKKELLPVIRNDDEFTESLSKCVNCGYKDRSRYFYGIGYNLSDLKGCPKCGSMAIEEMKFNNLANRPKISDK